MTDQARPLDIHNLPAGAVWCAQPEDMAKAYARLDTTLVLTPFSLSSRTKDLFRRALPSDRMLSSPRRDTPERFRLRETWLVPQEDAFEAVGYTLQEAYNFSRSDLSVVQADFARGVEIIRNTSPLHTVALRAEAQTRKFRGHGHGDKEIGGGVIVDRPTMTGFIFDGVLYRQPRDTLAVWSGLFDPMRPAQLHKHGVCPWWQPYRGLMSVFYK